MGTEQRRSGERVVFERGYDAHMMAIDGTWRRACRVLDVSEDGAKITIEESIVGLSLKEFFLLLSSPGLAYRRCELAWVNGEEIGVNFLKHGKQRRRAKIEPG
jgi:PilZ domain